MSLPTQPTLNAILNSISTILLVVGFVLIKRDRRNAHRNAMLMALAISAAFLASYLYYHYQVGSVKYPLQDWTRPVYFAILIPHVILAAAMCPFIVAIVVLAFMGRFTWHRRLARFVWPTWVIVSITGIIVYLMLYVYALGIRTP